MSETLQTEYQAFADMDGPTVPGKRFFVELSGVTNGAHLDMVREFQRIGQCEVTTVAESDYVLLFCPIASRVGTDITEALERAPVSKPVIMVVMHHTFNPDQVLAESKRQVHDPKVRLVVDCLFYNSYLLDSRVNDAARAEVWSFLGVSAQPGRGGNGDFWKALKDYKIFVVFGVIVVLVIVIVVASESLKRK